MLVPEHAHFGALEPIPVLQEAVSPSGQLTLHIWSSFSFAAAHSDCAETNCERLPKDIRAVKTSARLDTVRRISPSLGCKLANFGFLIAETLNLCEQKGLRCVPLSTRIVHGLWASQAGKQAFPAGFCKAPGKRSIDRLLRDRYAALASGSHGQALFEYAVITSVITASMLRTETAKVVFADYFKAAIVWAAVSLPDAPGRVRVRESRALKKPSISSRALIVG